MKHDNSIHVSDMGFEFAEMLISAGSMNAIHSLESDLFV